MPNKRKKGKKLIAAWVQSGDVEEFKARAEELGITATDLLTQLIREELKRGCNTKGSEENGNQKS